MKHTRKILVALLIVLTLVMSMVVVASAAKTSEPTTLYLTPNSNWKVDNARFAAYTWDGGEQWFDMTDSDGDGIYECVIPAGIENIIFCRMNPSATSNNWNNKWNQTADLKYDGTNNHYIVKEGTWDNGGGTWSLIQKDGCVHSPSGEGNVVTNATCTENGEISHLCSECGEEYTLPIAATGHSYDANGMCSCGASKYTVAGSDSKNEPSIFGTGWDVSNSANDLAYDEATGGYVKVYENVPAGSYKFKVVEDHSWDVSHGDSGSGDPDGNAIFTVEEAGSTVTISFKNGSISVKVTAPIDEPTPDPDHTHNFVDGKCECGESDPNYVAPDAIYIIAGDVMQVDSVYVEGINFLGTNWDVTNEANILLYDEILGCYIKAYENVYAGEYHFKVAENKSWDVSYGANGGQDNYYIKVDADGSTVTIMFKDGVPSATVEAPAAPEHTHNFVEGKCECGEFDPNYQPPHEHKFENGKCECGETDPNYQAPGQGGEDTPDEPQAELNFFQKIIKAVTDFFKSIGDWFANLFASFKK